MSATPNSYRALLRLPHVPALLAATCLARVAGRMFALTLVLFALARFDSPVLAGGLGFAVMAPGLALSPIAGALIDRAGSAWAIIIDMLASAGCVLLIVLADDLRMVGIPLLLGLVMLFSLTSPLSAAGIRTLLPRLIPPSARDRANALDTAIHGVVDVVGPALAGMLMGLAGEQPTLLLIAALYGGAAGCIAGVRHAEMAASGPGSAPLLAQALQGLHRVFRQATLRGLALSYGLYQVSWGIFLVTVPVVAEGYYPVGSAASATGMLWALSGLAGAMGSLVAGMLRTAGRERAVMALGMLISGLAAWPIASVFGLAGLVAGLILLGLLAGPVDVGLLTLRQRRTTPGELGRVLSISMSLNLVGLPLGSAVGGLLVAWSAAAAFSAAAIASALGALAVALIPDQDDTPCT